MRHAPQNHLHWRKKARWSLPMEYHTHKQYRLLVVHDAPPHPNQLVVAQYKNDH